jgi:hypothetical protein
MDKETVQEYVDDAQSALKTSPQMGETTTRTAILDKFIQLLGWEVPENAKVEYSVRAFGNTYRVDYAFTAEGSPVAFIEAKGAGRSLTNKHYEKMSSYMINENVDYGILTNANEYVFFDREVIDSKVNINTTAEIELNKLPENVRLLSRYEESELYSKRNASIKRGGLPYKCEDAIVFIENGKIVESFEKKGFQSDAMGEAVSFLIKNRNLIDNISIPYIPERKKNAVINDSPEHYAGKEMNTYKQLTSGHYLDVSMSRKKKGEVIRQMAEECGLYADFNW